MDPGKSKRTWNHPLNQEADSPLSPPVVVYDVGAHDAAASDIKFKNESKHRITQRQTVRLTSQKCVIYVCYVYFLYVRFLIM